MSLDVLFDPIAGSACLVHVETGWAFGPVFDGDNAVAELARFSALLAPDLAPIRDPAVTLTLEVMTRIQSADQAESAVTAEMNRVAAVQYAPQDDEAGDTPAGASPIGQSDASGLESVVLVDERASMLSPPAEQPADSDMPYRPLGAVDCWSCLGSGQEDDPSVGSGACSFCDGLGWRAPALPL